MQKKTIQKVLAKKFNEWCTSIDNQEVQKLVKKNTIITGGAIASMLLGEEVKDFDVYFKNKQTALAVAKYYVGKFNTKHSEITNRLGHKVKACVLDGEELVVDENANVIKVNNPDIISEFATQGIDKYGNVLEGAKISRMVANCPKERIKILVRSDGVAAEDETILQSPFEDVYDVLEEADKIDAVELENTEDKQEQKEKYSPIFLSTNAITLSNKIQCIIRFYGEPEDIHSSYDFIHATNYWTSWDNKVVTSVEALESLMCKHLKYMGSKYPLCSIIRTRKFINRGWHINAGQYLKMCLQVNELDLNNIDVLEDQLIGVDSAYFMMLINSIRNKQLTDSNFELNNSYIISIIDKIF
jgi:hypothetical protein